MLCLRAHQSEQSSHFDPIGIHKGFLTGNLRIFMALAGKQNQVIHGRIFNSKPIRSRTVRFQMASIRSVALAEDI